MKFLLVSAALWSAILPSSAQDTGEEGEYGDGRTEAVSKPATDTKLSGDPVPLALALDSDRDGIPNYFELETLGSDPFDRYSVGGDSDKDGLADGWERFYFGRLDIADPKAVSKSDGLSNEEKCDLGMNPHIDYFPEKKPAEPAKYEYDSIGRLTTVSGLPQDGGARSPDNNESQAGPK